MSIKKILLATHFLRGFSGSEMTILRLANFFKQQGYNVTVACIVKEELLEQEFLKVGINIYQLPCEQLKSNHFDLFWCQHVTTYYELIEKHNIAAEKTIFSSLSPFEAIETPPITDLLINLYLANSIETKNSLISLGISSPKILVFPNFIEQKDFLFFDEQKQKNIKKIAVVSNHIRPEILELELLFSSQNIQVDFYGLGHLYTPVDAELIANYDVLISIGRTVQLGFAVGVPVFCYDHYAGSGWITSENYEVNKVNNFSGRGTSTQFRTAIELMDEILVGFVEAFNKRSCFKQRVEQDNCLEININNVMEYFLNHTEFEEKSLINYQKHEARKINAIKDLYHNWFAAEALTKNKQIQLQTYQLHIDNQKDEIEAKENHIVNIERHIINIENQLEVKNNYIENLNNELKAKQICINNKKLQIDIQVKEWERLCNQVDSLANELQSVYRSKSWKVTKPIRFLSKKLKRLSPLLLHPVLLGEFFYTKLFKKFDSDKYLLANPDIKASDFNPLVHYLRYGRGEQRSLFPVLADNSVVEQTDSPYNDWIKQNDTHDIFKIGLMRHHILKMKHQPLISIVMPTYNTPDWALKAAIDSVRNQIYPYWELCIADDASTQLHVKEILMSYEQLDSRIKVKYRTENGHISLASNSALNLVTGEFIALLDHDDVLPINALYEVARAINANPEAKMFYSDEDKINEQGNRCDPYFKSDWNPDLFLAQNMFSHLGVYQTKLIHKVGGFRQGVEGSQDYDLALRCLEVVGHKAVHHIPKILYHWRMLPGSAAVAVDEKPYTTNAALKAIQEYLDRQKIKAIVDEVKPKLGYYRVKYALPEILPKVSIIIPTRDGKALVEQCIESILNKTTYTNYEILLIDNGSRDTEALAYFALLNEKPQIRVIRDDSPFNYSALNNNAVKESTGEIICLLNNDIEVITPDWLDEMVSHALRPEIGVVGARLWYPNDHLQHGGVVLGIYGIAGHVFHNLTRSEGGYFARAWLTQNYSAVTAACLVVRKSVYEQVNGLEEELTVAFNDVDFCIRVRDAGYRNLWTPFAELYHHESATRGSDQTPEKIERFHQEISLMMERHGENLERDPFYNPNLDLYKPFQLAAMPR